MFKSMLAAAAAFAAMSAVCVAQQSGIIATTENGRKIFVNDESPAPYVAPAADASAPATSHLVYWSNTQHRWKPVPPPSRRQMRGARSAAAEVRALVARTPMTPLPAGAKSESPFAEFSSPDTRSMTAGHKITQTQVDAAIAAASTRHHVDPNLVRSIIKVESNFNPHAVSRKGAMGLMQLMPATARDLNVTNPFDVEQNVEAGTKHFKGLLDNFNGDVSKSLAAYNAGAGAVTRHNGVPPYAETRDYVKRITKLYGQDNPFPAVASTSIHVDKDGAGRKIFTNE
jgi:hypothetical protein